MLDRTQIVLASEFSRDCLVEGKPDRRVPDQVDQPAVINELKFYGMHRHFTGASSVLLFGGGAKKGLLYGKTAPERPARRSKTRSTSPTCTPRCSTRLGIPADYQVEVEQRPFYVTKDGRGEVRRELLN